MKSDYSNFCSSMTSFVCSSQLADSPYSSYTSVLGLSAVGAAIHPSSWCWWLHGFVARLCFSWSKRSGTSTYYHTHPLATTLDAWCLSQWASRTGSSCPCTTSAYSTIVPSLHRCCTHGYERLPYCSEMCPQVTCCYAWSRLARCCRSQVSCWMDCYLSGSSICSHRLFTCLNHLFVEGQSSFLSQI